MAQGHRLTTPLRAETALADAFHRLSKWDKTRHINFRRFRRKRRPRLFSRAAHLLSRLLAVSLTAKSGREGRASLNLLLTRYSFSRASYSAISSSSPSSFAYSNPSRLPP